MKVSLINQAKQFVQRKIETRKTAKYAVDQLYNLYGNKIKSYDVFTNRSGVVSALGFPTLEGGKYTHAYSVMPDGKHIQKVIERKATPEGIVKSYITVIADAFGKYDLNFKTVTQKIDIKSEDASFTLKQKPTIIDITKFIDKK